MRLGFKSIGIDMCVIECNEFFFLFFFTLLCAMAVWLLSSHQCVHLIRLVNCACLYKRNAYFIYSVRADCVKTLVLHLCHCLDQACWGISTTQNKQTLPNHRRLVGSTSLSLFLCFLVVYFPFISNKSMTATMKIMVKRVHLLHTIFSFCLRN